MYSLITKAYFTWCSSAGVLGCPDHSSDGDNSGGRSIDWSFGYTPKLPGRRHFPQGGPQDRPLLLRQQLQARPSGATVHRNHREKGSQAASAHERNRFQKGK